MRPGEYGHMFCSALQRDRWYEMLSKAKEKINSDRDGSEDIVAKKGDGKKKAVFNDEGVPLVYNREENDMVTRGCSRTAHQFQVFEQTVRFWRKNHCMGMCHLT